MHRCNAKCEVRSVHCQWRRPFLYVCSEEYSLVKWPVWILVQQSVHQWHMFGFVAARSLLKVSISLLEAVWVVFGDVLGRLGSVFRTSWGSWGRLGSVLGASWGVFGASWRRPRVFSRFSGALKPYWDRLGAVLEAPGSALEAPWRRFGGAWHGLGGVLGASWRFWSRLWSDITPIVDF